MPLMKKISETSDKSYFFFFLTNNPYFFVISNRPVAKKELHIPEKGIPTEIISYR